MIAEAMPRFDKLSTAFKDDSNFQHILGYFYADILEFHRRAYKLFRQGGKLPHTLLYVFDLSNSDTLHQAGKSSLIPFGKLLI